MKDRSQYYRGFVAESYDLLVPENEFDSYEFFQEVIAAQGEPALELGCGTGRPLLSFVASGLDVEGLDSSLDMIERCRAKAKAAGIEARLHHQRMESFSIDRRFRTIFIVSSSFMLLPDLEAARQAVQQIRRHLEPGGRMLLGLHIPEDPGPREGWKWELLREARRPEEGSIVRCLQKTERYDEHEQVLETRTRYELEVDGEVRQREEFDFLLRWHTQEQFSRLLTAAGFEAIRAVRGNWDASQPGDPAFVFVATAGPSASA